ncbi:hypothetical protein BP5796_03358 [Coleophoma crateriformis]|uniref:Uncharacterized protein n=1 Tax=Coleophoma crateriformis TaxID=565419 RepID=A0A3D8SNA3_9HELO|nr:hypothetical protein BP5796_03358 [Coleophoma crateriformis]
MVTSSNASGNTPNPEDHSIATSNVFHQRQRNITRPPDVFSPFQRYSSSIHDFNALCLYFESGVFDTEQLYRTVKDNLMREFLKFAHDLNDSRIVSDIAQSQRRLPEFCLARLIELRRSGLSTKVAKQSIAAEVREGNWEVGHFLSSILADGDANLSWIDRYMSASLRRAFIFRGLDALSN